MSILTKEQVKDVVELYDIKTAEDAHDAVKDLMKDVLQRTLDAELSNTLGYDKHDTRNKKTANSWNGSYKKGVRSSLGSMSLNVPRDRDREHVPLIVKKGQTDVSSIDERYFRYLDRWEGICKILAGIREWQDRAVIPNIHTNGCLFRFTA